MTEKRLRLRRDAVEWREVEGEIVALDLRNQTYVTLNRSGATIWELLDKGTSWEQLAERLIELFRIERDDATADLDAFLMQLEERGLLEVQDS